MGDKGAYFKSSALTGDKFANREFRTSLNKYFIEADSKHKFGNEKESISEVLGYNILAGSLTTKGKILVKILSKKHCLDAIQK